jgi:membrane protease YdiL (CAAX protease family)
MTEENKKRLKLFLILAFGISWTAAIVIIATGGLENSPEVIADSGITLAVVLLASVYMWGPAIANILTHIITKEGWSNHLLNSRLKKTWPYWVTAWITPGLLTRVGAALFFVLFPSYYDADLSTLKAQLEASGMADQIANPIPLIIQQIVIAIVLSPILNFGATFGEEFGWRGYLQPKLEVLGKRKALIITSVIWGIWHWPIIWLGHNYGLDYWGYPWLGLLATVWFTLSIGVFFGWLSMKAKNVWPAVIAHSAINGMASIGLLFVADASYPTILGPSPAGIIGVLPFTLISAIIFLTIKD